MFSIFTIKEETEKSTPQRSSGVKVSQNTFNFQEDGTEVLQEEEATSTKLVSEGTEDLLRLISLTHYQQNNAQPYPRKYTSFHSGIKNYTQETLKKTWSGKGKTWPLALFWNPLT